MGGKHKLANRTKNNARPSSSGRSAELLGSTLPQFVGFSGIKDGGLGLGGFSLGTTDDIEASVDPNFQLVLKKITKKDSTTKLKGLQEFAELVKSVEQDAIKPILPVWPRFYNILATDVDNRVREAAHQVHHQIVLKAKRNIAPYLKQLMAPWFTSQYDTYPPAASAAVQAFQDAFPKNKFQEAIVFCQEEILFYINDNLLVQTAQTLNTTKQVSPEDAEAKYERVLVSCLQGYCLYLEKVPAEHIQSVATLNNDIISNGKFWKLARHKVAPIRGAWYKVLTIICQKALFLLEGKNAQVVSTVIGNLEENEPTVLPYVWEAALLTMSNIKEWWAFINVDKLFFPKLWKVLKQAGQGNATVIYPSLLPLISHFPPTVDENSHQFYGTLFENFRLGLKQKSVIASRSESVAVATAFVECLQYVILKKQSDVTLCKTLIKNHLIATVEWCLTEEQASYKSIFNQITSLVIYWSRNSQTENLKSYLQFFFDNVSDLFREILFNVKESRTFDVIAVCSKQMEFLQSLKHISKPKKQFKVKFSTDELDSAENTQDAGTSIIEGDTPYFETLSSLVYNICEDYVKYIEEKRCRGLFEHLCSLIVDFNTKDFFINLNEKMKKKDEKAQIIDIYNNMLYKWLTDADLSCKQIVDLIFLLFRYVNEKDKEMILTTLTEVSNEDCLGWCISEALSHPHNKDQVVKTWLKNEKVSKFVVSIAEKEINDDCSTELSVLFKLALTENEDGELFVHKDAILQIIEKLVAVLENFTDYSVTVDTCSSLAAYIAAIIYTENLLLTYGDKLLLSLYKLSCNSFIDNDIITTETVYEVSTAWQDAVTLLSKGLTKDETKTLANKFADIVETEFLASNMEENVLDHLISTIVNFIRALYRSIPLSASEFLRIFLERAFVPPWRSNIEGLCRVAEYVSGNLSSPYEEISMPTNVIETDILKYFSWTYVKCSVIVTALHDQFDEDIDDDEPEEVNRNPVFILNVMDNSEEVITQILYDLSVGQTYLENFKNTKFYDTVLHYYVLTEMKIKDVIKTCNKDFLSNIKRILKEKSVNLGWFWCKTAYIFYSDIVTQPLTDIYREFVSEIVEMKCLGALHLTQLFSKHISYDYILNRYETIGNIIVLRSLVYGEEIDVQIAEVFGQIEKIRSENVPQFLYNSTNINWEKTQEIIEIVRLCSGLMKHKFDTLGRKHWDFGVLSLVSWASNCLKARASYEKYEFQALLNSVVSLYSSADSQIKALKDENINCNYIDEWDNVLVESIHGDLAQLWLYLAEQLETKQDPITYLPLIREFGTVVNNIKQDFIFKFNDTSLPKWTKFLKRSCSLLISAQPNLQVWGYKMLLVLVPGLVTIDSEAVNTNTPHKKGLIFEQFKEKLVETHEIVNSMLMGFKLGEDSCRVEPSTDSFTYTFAYLLLWDVLLTLCEQSSTELRYQYADWLRNEDLLKNFLNNLFRLMPTEVLHCNEEVRKSKSLQALFLEKPGMDVRESYNSERIEHLVCWLYGLALSQLPALVRQWWTNLETKVAQVVEKVTTVYVSPQLCVQELNDVMTHQTKFKNMTIKVHPSVREVTAIYTVDEAQMELVITLPANYPLGSLEVQCNRQIGGTTHKQWLLQLKKCVLHQNGRIWDGLSLWNNNLDKKFDGVEECYICFAVLHPGTYQLPKLSCQTCRKKFHSACLYKWFSTTNKSSCPICRNLF